MKAAGSFYRRLLAAVLAAALLCLCAGCGGRGGAGETLKTVRINVSAEPDSLDPWQSAASDTEGIFHNVFEGLCSYDETGELTAGLAESWEATQDGVYTFHLRQGVTFHNGKAFTSADVLYTYNSLTGLGGGEPLTSKFSMVEKLEAPDDYTFVVTLSEPSASFLSLTITPILPEGYEDQASHPVGTGPFKFVEYTPSQRVVLEKYEDYYRKGPNGETIPQIDRVEVYIMTDPAAVISALQSGQLDAAVALKAEDAKTLNEDFTIVSNPQNMVQSLYLNNTRAPFDDVRVRQAVCYAIDRSQVAEGVFGGYATELYTNFSPVMKRYYNQELEGSYNTDQEKAKALLKEAGLENGFDMTITVPANYQPHIDTAQIVAQQLSAVGINAKIETMEWATWLEQVYTNADYQSTIVGLTGKLDPDSVLGRFETGYSRNFCQFSNEEYDELIDGARTELDEEKRAEMYQRCEAILTEQAVSAFLTDPHLVVACRKDLRGYTFYPVTFYDFSKLHYQE